MSDEPAMDSDAVPTEFVDAGAPARLSEWTDAQKDAYFRGESGELIEGETPARLEANPVGTDDGWGGG